MIWRQMSLLESGSWKTWEISVANQQFAKCVKVCLRDIGDFEGQNDMETGRGEYWLSLLIQFKIMQYETFLNW